MSRVQLPDGAWAELWAPKKVPDRKRRGYTSAMAELSEATADLPEVTNPFFGKRPNQPEKIPDPRHLGRRHTELSDAVRDALVLCLVKEWSFGEVTDDVLSGLPADASDELFMKCRELATDLLPDYSPDIDPKVTTTGSSSPPTPSSTDPSTFEIPSYAPTS